MADRHCYEPESLMAAIGDDRTSGAGIVMLQSLNAHGMAPAVTDLIEQGASGFDATVPILLQLPMVETAERSIAYRMKSARFPAFKDLRGFEPVTSEINGAVVRCFTNASSSPCLQCSTYRRFWYRNDPVATALGMLSIKNHRRKFSFCCKIEPVNPHEKAKAKCKAGQLALIV